MYCIETTRRAFVLGAVAAAGAAAVSPAAASARTTVIDFAIAGSHYYALHERLALIDPGHRLGLMRDARNPHDQYAVAVYDAVHKLGFVPRAASRRIAELLDAGKTLEATVIAFAALEAGVKPPRELVYTCVSHGEPIIRISAIRSPMRLFG